jgi:hypothetical protein
MPSTVINNAPVVSGIDYSKVLSSTGFIVNWEERSSEVMPRLEKDEIIIIYEEEYQNVGIPGTFLNGMLTDPYLIINADTLIDLSNETDIPPVVVIPVSQKQYSEILMRLISKYDYDMKDMCEGYTPLEIIKTPCLYEAVYEELRSESVADLVDIANGTRNPWLDVLDTLNGGNLTRDKACEIAGLASNSKDADPHLEDVKKNLIASYFGGCEIEGVKIKNMTGLQEQSDQDIQPSHNSMRF